MARSELPVVQTVGLTKVFKDFWRRPRVEAVKDINIEIHPGEVFGLLGPNGSGKSTTIKMILGLLYPSRGRISVFGRPPTDVTIKKRIGYLPEESYLYQFLDARETLDFYGRLFRQHGQVRGKRLKMLLDMVGLQNESKRRIGEYSKGMARRIGLAQALINDPEFVILDEPTSGLDPIGTRQIKDLIRKFGDMGKTILLSSHLLADVEDVCDRVCILYGGKERTSGNINDLLSQTNLTQITTEKLAPGTIAEIRNLLHRMESKEIIRVDAPRDRLESLFLKIVQEAQAARLSTSGVGATGEIAEFLGSGTSSGEEVIKSLIEAAGREAPDKPVEIMTKPEPAPPSSHVLSQLLAANAKKEQKSKGPTSLEPAADTPPPSTDEVKADRNVIDGLLGNKEKDNG